MNDDNIYNLIYFKKSFFQVEIFAAEIIHHGFDLTFIFSKIEIKILIEFTVEFMIQFA